jgi:hypothetical protein
LSFGVAVVEAEVPRLAVLVVAVAAVDIFL